MPVFGSNSKRRLEGVHPDLVLICTEAIKHFDFTVLCGIRTESEQDEVFTRGMSKVRWPDSNHNVTDDRPKALAVDLAPWPVEWAQDRVTRFFYLAGVIQTVASVLDMYVRWGHDWNSNQNFYDQGFLDAPHFELVRGRNNG